MSERRASGRIGTMEPLILVTLLSALFALPASAWAVQAFLESAGQVVMEAENADANIPRSSKSWTLQTSSTGYSGSGYMLVGPGTGGAINTGYVTTSPELVYNVQFTTTGTYYVWIRGIGPTGSSDSIHTGIDGTGPSTADRMGLNTTTWQWSRSTMDGPVATLVVSTPGFHTIHVWMRESLFNLDKLLLRTSSSSTAPSGTGPAQSARGYVTGPLPSNAFIGEYWNLPSTSGAAPAFPTTAPTATRTDAVINFNWGSGSPMAGVNTNDFAIRWQGRWDFATTGTYEFRATTDDGVRIYLDGVLLINQWRDKSATLVTAQTTVTAGTHTVAVEYYENSGSAVAQVSWAAAATGDTTAPTGSVTINSGAASTSTTAVTLTLSATDNSGSVSQMQFSNDGTTYSTPEAYATTKAWTLTGGNGTKTVYARFSDPSGNWSAAATDTIGLDATAPTISAVSASGVTSTGATITWTTNEAATSRADYGTTTAYGQSQLDPALVTSHSVTLSGLTAATLYHYRVTSVDAANNSASSADFTFTTAAASDTTPPTGTVTINNGAAFTKTTTVTLTVSATDTGGAVTEMEFSNDGTTFSARQPYATTAQPWTLTSGDGLKAVYAKFKDAAGNWSAPVSDTITLDTTAPTFTFTSPTDNQILPPPTP